jgi:hypothetical protein
MACRGVHFAVTEQQATALLEAADDDAVRDIIEGFEETWEKGYLAESDKAWDAIHRSLTDGQLESGGGAYPFSHCVVGPRQLYEGDEYIVSLVLPNEVRDVAHALRDVTESWFKERYASVVPHDYAPEYGDQDRDYTWSYFEEVRDLFAKAAESGRAIVFTVDQ